jgi:MinD superfamily P-loop ATPase
MVAAVLLQRIIAILEDTKMEGWVIVNRMRLEDQGILQVADLMANKTRMRLKI